MRMLMILAAIVAALCSRHAAEETTHRLGNGIGVERRWETVAGTDWRPAGVCSE
jgi:hypothetical protein